MAGTPPRCAVGLPVGHHYVLSDFHPCDSRSLSSLATSSFTFYFTLTRTALTRLPFKPPSSSHLLSEHPSYHLAPHTHSGISCQLFTTSQLSNPPGPPFPTTTHSSSPVFNFPPSILYLTAHHHKCPTPHHSLFFYNLPAQQQQSVK